MPVTYIAGHYTSPTEVFIVGGVHCAPLCDGQCQSSESDTPYLLVILFITGLMISPVFYLVNIFFTSFSDRIPYQVYELATGGNLSAFNGTVSQMLPAVLLGLIFKPNSILRNATVTIDLSPSHIYHNNPDKLYSLSLMRMCAAYQALCVYCNPHLPCPVLY